MAQDSLIQGYCSPKFREAETAFANNFAEFQELSAACCVYVSSEKVVNLWGGWAHVAKTQPWQENTLSGLYSVGKGFLSFCALRAANHYGFELDSALTDIWPKYGQLGKHQTNLRHLLTHRAGLPAIRQPLADKRALRLAINGLCPDLSETLLATRH